jgi:hypothetical protein
MSSSNCAAPPDIAQPFQRSLAFDGPNGDRHEAELRHSFTKALLKSVRGGVSHATLKESFGHAMTGLTAGKGVLLSVRQEVPPDVAILCASGLSPEEQAACLALGPSPGINTRVIRRTIQAAEAVLVDDSKLMEPKAPPSLDTRPCSALCAPVTDSLTGAVTAALYF